MVIHLFGLIRYYILFCRDLGSFQKKILYTLTKYKTLRKICGTKVAFENNQIKKEKGTKRKTEMC